MAGRHFIPRRRPLSAVSCFRVVALFSLLATAPAAAADNPLADHVRAVNERLMVATNRSLN